MLETQREYALERLEATGEAARVRRRHLDHFARLADQARRELVTGADQLHVYDAIELDLDNHRAAIGHALELGAAACALRMAIALSRFWIVRGHIGEGRRWLLAGLALEDQPDAHLRAKALARTAAFSLRLGLHDEAQRLLDESIELYRATADREGLADAVLLAGNVRAREGDQEGALALFVEAAASYGAIGNRMDFASALNNAGCLRFLLGDYAGAAADCTEAVRLNAALGNRQHVSGGLLNAAFALLELGDEAGAAASLEEGVAIARELGHREQLASALECYATVAARRGDHRPAARLLGAAEAVREALATETDPFELATHDRVAAAVAAALDPDTLATALAQGRALELDEALAEAQASPSETGAPVRG
jgi:tetratricopeptide (TPR) repeat protein